MRNYLLRWSRAVMPCALFVGTAGGGIAGAHAADGWRTTVLEENDSLYFNSDKHYTQGLRISVLSPELKENWANDVFDFMPLIFPQGGARRVSFFAGQSIFTPKNIDIKPPDPTDRPYAGWLYGGISFLQETKVQELQKLENLEVDLGLVGPGALGKQVQNDFHQFIGIHQAQGWSNQVQHEIGGDVSYEQLWRIPVPLLSDEDEHGASGVDIVPQFGGTAGNVFTYGEVGGMLRIGRHLETDYGPARIRPALSGTDYFNPARLGDEWGYYIFAGVQGRAVARNIFLDGNDFRESASVTHKTFVADFQAGASVFWSSHIRADASVVRRTREFVGQRHPDVIGTAAVAFTW